jgi:hypothetical protein
VAPPRTVRMKLELENKMAALIDRTTPAIGVRCMGWTAPCFDRLGDGSLPLVVFPAKFTKCHSTTQSCKLLIALFYLLSVFTA